MIVSPRYSSKWDTIDNQPDEQKTMTKFGKKILKRLGAFTEALEKNRTTSDRLTCWKRKKITPRRSIVSYNPAFRKITLT